MKIYIENQLNKKEKEMLKEYQQTLDKQTKDSNKKFDKINEILIAIKGDLDNIKNN